MTFLTSQVGGRLRREREAHGWSQAELGQRLGMPQSHISKIEKGADMRLSTLLAIARLLQLELVLVPKKLVPAMRHLMASSPGTDDYVRPLPALIDEISGTPDE